MSQEKIKVLDMLKEGIISTEDALKLLDKLSENQDKEGNAIIETNDNIHTVQDINSTEQPQTATTVIATEDDEHDINCDDDDCNANDTNNDDANNDNTITDDTNTGDTNADDSNTGDTNADDSNTYNYGYSNNNYSNSNGYSQSSYSTGQNYADWANDLKNNILESTRNLTNYISSQAYFHTYGPFGFGSQLQTCEMESNEIPSNIPSLSLTGKNDKVEVTGYNGKTIKITASFKAKGNMDPRVHFEDAQGNYGVFYDYNAVYAMGLYVKVPHTRLDALHVETKNSSILLSDLQVERADIVTKNAPIYLNRLSGKEMIADSSNAPVKVDNVHFNEIRLKTSNSNITLSEFDADFVLAKTSNANITVDAIDIGQLEAFTSNAGISINSRFAIPNSKYSLHNVIAKTNNGHVNIRIPELAHSASRLKASTSYGKISVAMGNTEYHTKTSNYVDAKTPGYETADKKWNLDLQTSNASIYVKSY